MAKADRTAKKRSKAKAAKRKPVPRGTTKLPAKKMELRHIPWSAVELEDFTADLPQGTTPL